MDCASYRRDRIQAEPVPAEVQGAAGPSPGHARASRAAHAATRV